MSKTSPKYTIDGFVFPSKKEFTYYQQLKALQAQGTISSFSFSPHWDEEKNTTLHKIKPICIDDFSFSAKVDADYYLQLKSYQHQGVIQSFVLTWLQAKEDVKSKFSAKKVEIDEFLFDSKEEANFYIHLLQEKQRGVINSFSLQPSFELQPSFKKDGKHYQKIEYIADFEVTHVDGTVDIIDVKGMLTPVFKLKQKLFEYKYPDKKLVLMKYVEKYGGWISLDEWKRRKKK